MTAATDTVTIDRAEFEAALDEFEGLAYFYARSFAGGDFEAFVCRTLFDLRWKLARAAGFPDPMQEPEDVGQARDERTSVIEERFLAEYVATLAPEAVTS